MKTTSPSLLTNTLHSSSIGAIARRGMTRLHLRLSLLLVLACCLLPVNARAAACPKLTIKPTVTMTGYTDHIYVKFHVAVVVSGGSGHYWVMIPCPQDDGYVIFDAQEVSGKPGQRTVRADFEFSVYRQTPDCVDQRIMVSDYETGIYASLPVSYKISSKYGSFHGDWETEEGILRIAVSESGKMFKAENDHFTVIGRIIGNGTVLDGTFRVTDMSLDPYYAGYSITAWSNAKYKTGRFVAVLDANGGWIAKWGWGQNPVKNVMHGW